MSDKIAKFKYSASEGIIEIEGSEKFVSDHMETITDLVRIFSRHTSKEVKKDQSKQLQDPPTEDEESPDSDELKLATYPKVFSEINEKLKIICKIPGSSKREKMLNTALLYCYGSKLMGDDQVPSKEIRSACEEHGILDSANFASIFNDKTTFLTDGVKGGAKSVKLTFGGEEKAKELADDLSQ